MYCDHQEVYWWDGLKRDIVEFVAKCPNCQQVKAKHHRQGGLTQVINVPTWTREDINMDFIVGMPWIRRQNDLIWVIVDRLIQSAHFIPVKSTYLAEDYAILYLYKTMSSHGIPCPSSRLEVTNLLLIFGGLFKKV